MKKIFFLIALCLSVLVNAQDSKFFQKISGGVMFGAFANASFKGNKIPFTLGYNLSPVVTICTPKTYHNIMYGTGDNSLKFLNGCFLKRNWDIYLIYSKTIHTGGNYFGCGIEKMVKVENSTGAIKCFLLTEVGIDFLGSKSFSVGLLVYPQFKFWERK